MLTDKNQLCIIKRYKKKKLELIKLKKRYKQKIVNAVEAVDKALSKKQDIEIEYQNQEIKLNFELHDMIEELALIIKETNEGE